MGGWRQFGHQVGLGLAAAALMTAPAWAKPAPAAVSAPVSAQESLLQITKLSEEALDSIEDALGAYGELRDFGDRYGTATRGLLDELISEWTVATEISEAIAPDASDPRLIQIRALIAQSRSDSESFVNTAKERSRGLVASDNAVRFRQRQIALYSHLLGGLKRDRELLHEVLRLSSSK